MLDGWNNLVVEGNDANFIYHGRMIPLVIKQSTNCTLKDLSIDFENPQIAQVQVVKNQGTEGITFEVAPWVKYRINERDTLKPTVKAGRIYKQAASLLSAIQNTLYIIRAIWASIRRE